MKPRVCSTLYALVFLVLIPLPLALEQMTARLWADLFLMIAAACGLYALSYILFLRKKDGVGLGRAIARFFLYASCAYAIRILISYAFIYFTGFPASSYLLHETYTPVTGWSAIDGWTNLVYLPVLSVCVLYIVIYCCVSRKLQRIHT